MQARTARTPQSFDAGVRQRRRYFDHPLREAAARAGVPPAPARHRSDYESLQKGHPGGRLGPHRL